jgi:hypothetical protein
MIGWKDVMHGNHSEQGGPRKERSIREGGPIKLPDIPKSGTQIPLRTSTPTQRKVAPDCHYCLSLDREVPGS